MRLLGLFVGDKCNVEEGNNGNEQEHPCHSHKHSGEDYYPVLAIMFFKLVVELHCGEHVEEQARDHGEHADLDTCHCTSKCLQEADETLLCIADKSVLKDPVDDIACCHS